MFPQIIPQTPMFPGRNHVAVAGRSKEPRKPAEANSRTPWLSTSTPRILHLDTRAPREGLSNDVARRSDPFRTVIKKQR